METTQKVDPNRCMFFLFFFFFLANALSPTFTEQESNATQDNEEKEAIPSVIYFVAFVKDNATMSSISFFFFENYVRYFVQIEESRPC